MLTSKEKKQLRGYAQTIRPLFQLGKEGITPNLIRTLNDSLEVHELIKISLLKTCPVDLDEASFDVAYLTKSEVIQKIGKTFVIYKKSKKNKYDL